MTKGRSSPVYLFKHRNVPRTQVSEGADASLVANRQAVQVGHAGVQVPIVKRHGAYVGVRPPLGVDVHKEPVFLNDAHVRTKSF